MTRPGVLARQKETGQREPVLTETLQLSMIVRDLEARMQTYVDEYGIGPWQIYEFDPDAVEPLPLPGGVYDGVTFAYLSTDEDPR